MLHPIQTTPKSFLLKKILFPLYLREKNKYQSTLQDKTHVKSLDSRANPRKPVLCRSCLNYLTDTNQKMNVNGSYQHSFINPAEHVFDIGCFKEVQGCIVKGTPLLRHSWFQGYAWSYCHCSSCNLHIGWQFSNINMNVFYGLILNCLYEPDIQSDEPIHL